ncbi:MAG: rhodanese-like domain-containing protein [Nitriliruptorales bacterium]|nr:rhodanese-like domain-containing protein [Nitriliruptorales bacterium]
MPERISPEEAWQRYDSGDAQILDLRTRFERRRYGRPPGAPKVSLLRHILWPEGDDTIYLCQHANRSKLTGWRGAREVAGGWEAWREADLPVDEAT